MNSHKVVRLPAPPHGKLDWPWMHETTTLMNMCNGEWLRISIIIPTYNQARYLEQTIRSILLQEYPNLELIIIDGGSTDGSVEIIKKYTEFINYWTSEKDRGQTHAINKGLEKASGDILAYLNSDDIYLPGAFFAVAQFVKENPDVDLVYGGCQVIDEFGNKTGERWGDISSLLEILDLWDVWWKKKNFVQPEVFWTRRIAEKTGPFREELYFVMDYEYWLRIFMGGGKSGKINHLLAAFRITSDQKSCQSAKVAVELLDVVKPVLWDPNTPIQNYHRLKLQSRWLYQQYFLKEVEKSIRAGEKTITRWTRLLATIIRHPRMLFNPALCVRVLSILRRFSFKN